MFLSELNRYFLIAILIASSFPSSAQQESAKDRPGTGTRQKTSNLYQSWLNEDVRWIITPEERRAFKQLSDDNERDDFIETFWQRRDPTPDTLENEFKDEHYRRIAYANEHFGAAVRGLETDRGRIYIVYGAPDKVESYPPGAAADWPQSNKKTVEVYARQVWRYHYLKSIGDDVILRFVDLCRCGNYLLTLSDTERDIPLDTDGALPGTRQDREDQNQRTAGTMCFISVLVRPPRVRFPDLEEVVAHKISVTLMPFSVRTDFARLTSITTLVRVNIEIRNRDLMFPQQNGSGHDDVNIFGRLTTSSGHVAETFEDQLQVNRQPEATSATSTYVKALPLRVGRYRLSLAILDVKGDRIGTRYQDVVVP